MNKSILLVWIQVFTLLICKAQPYYFKHYETDDGLINNSVNTIFQDRSGFIWVGTSGGLTRYDGYVFKTFNNKTDKFGNLWNNFITTIAEDKAGKIWIGTGNGIFTYNPYKETFTPFKIAPSTYINGFVIDARNDLWFLAQNRLYHYSEEKKKVEDLKLHVSRIAKDLNGNLLLGNYAGILFTYNIVTKVVTQRSVITKQIPENLRAITKIYPISKDTILIGYKQGLKLYNIKTGSVKSISLFNSDETDTFVHDITADHEHDYWIATQSGLYIYNIATNTSLRLQKKPGDPYAISDNSVHAVYKDHDGDMWAGTFFGGLNYLSKENARFEKYYPIPLTNTISGSAVSQICPDNKGNLWIATEDAGINQFTLKTGKFTNYLSKPHNGKRGPIYSNIHGVQILGNNLFIGSYLHGMQIMDLRTGNITAHFKTVNAPGEKGSDFVVCVYLAKDSTLFVGTTGDYAGLFTYNRPKKTFNRIKQLPFESSIYHITEDHEGNIWAGTKSECAFFYNPKTGRYSNFSFGETGNEFSIHYVMEDSNHAMWFSTIGGGLIRLNPDRKTFKTFTTKTGLPTNVLFGMLEDNAKQLWIGSAKGLICFDLRTEKIKVYTQSNGLITNQFNLNSAYKDSTGKMYFGSVKGLIAFNPANLTYQHHNPQTYFTGLQINNKEIAPLEPGSPLKKSISYTDTIILKPDQNSFSIEFATLDYASPSVTHYDYVMSRRDRSWTYSNSSRRAYFTDLSAGDYIFIAKAKSNDGGWAGTERRVFIKILPPFWKSNMAYFIYLLITGFIIYLGVRYYHSYQERKNDRKLKLFEHQKEREIYQAKIEFFTNIAHEIQTPLTLISVPVERVLAKAEDYPSIKKSLLTIGKYTKRLIDLTSQLLDFRQTEMEQFGLNFVNIDLNKLLRDQVDSFRELALENKINLKLNLPPDKLIAFADREALVKIWSNLISNALKYAATYTVVTLFQSESDKSSFSISFSNDGKEIPLEFRNKIFEPFFRLRAKEKPGTGIGLSLAKSLAELHTGTLVLASGELNNIVFLLTLPIHQQFEFNLSSWKKIK